MDCEGRSHNYGFSPKSSLRGAVGFDENLIRLNGSPKPYPMVVHTPIVSRWLPRGGWIQSFLLLGHPPMTGRASRLAVAMTGSLVRGCLLAILS